MSHCAKNFFYLSRGFSTLARSTNLSLWNGKHITQRVLAQGIYRNLFIQTGDTPNPLSQKYILVLDEADKKQRPGAVLAEKDSLDFASYKEAQVSPLARSLFRIDGVTRVFISPQFVTITKTEEAEWASVNPHIFASIMDWYSSNLPLLTETLHRSGNDITEEDSDTVALIKEILDSRIRPVVQDDGGDIEFKSFENGIVKLKLQGSCSGCPSSLVTLKGGIENMLMHYVPEVSGVEEFLDESDLITDKEFQKLEQKLQDKTNT
eukprot:Sdes_comp17694_c0_seq2m6962